MVSFSTRLHDEVIGMLICMSVLFGYAYAQGCSLDSD